MATILARKDHKNGKTTIKIKAKNKGKLHEDLGIAQDKKIPTKTLNKAEKNASPAEKKRIVFAKNAKQWAKK